MQWINTQATSTNFQALIPIPFTSRSSYIVVTAEGDKDCETRTSQEDTEGYDFNIAIDQKYNNKINFTVVKNRKIFALMIGY